MKRSSILATALVLASLLAGTTLAASLAYSQAADPETQGKGQFSGQSLQSLTPAQAPAVESKAGYTIKGTDCFIKADNPHIRTHASRRTIGAKGGIVCQSPKERIWVKLSLVQFNDGPRTIASRPRDRGGAGERLVTRNDFTIGRVCTSNTRRPYQLFVRGTVVKTNGDVHRSRTSSRIESENCGVG